MEIYDAFWEGFGMADGVLIIALFIWTMYIWHVSVVPLQWRVEEIEERLLPEKRDPFDIWHVNVRELERRVAELEKRPLPDKSAC